MIDATGASVKEAYANAVQIRRAALKDQDRTFGYPTIVNTAAIARGDRNLQQALASLFTVKYGSIVVMENSGLCRSTSTVWSETERIYRSSETNEG